MRLPSLWEPRWYSDEGTFMTVAWVHSLGAPLYSGVFDVNPPGIYWLYGVLLKAGADQHHVVVQLALLLAVVTAVLGIYSIATTWFGPQTGTAAALLAAAGLSLPTLDGDLLNIEVAALPFFVLAVALALRRSNGAAVAAGILTGCALLIRPSYVVDSVALLFAFGLVPRARWRAPIAVAAGLLVGAVAAMVLALDHSLAAYVGETMALQRAYVIWANGGSLFPLIVRLLLLAAVSLFWYWRVRRLPWRPLAIWIPASIAAASITPRELSHYVLEAVPPLSIGIAAFAIWAWRRLALRQTALRIIVAASTSVLAMVCLVGVAEGVLILPARETALLQGTRPPPPFLHNFSYAGLPGYYGRWLSSVVRQPLRSQPLKGFPGPFPEEQAEAAILDRLAAGSTVRIQLLGDRAWVYFLSRLPPATRYIAMNSGFRLVPGASDTVAEALADHRAQLVAVADVPRAEWVARLERNGYRLVGSAPWPTYAAP